MERKIIPVLASILILSGFAITDAFGATGTVKFFNEAKTSGFIEQDSDSSLIDFGPTEFPITDINVGDKVSYEIFFDGESETAINLELNTIPEVTITALPSTGVAPLIVDFTCSTVGGNGEIRYEWDFGDGATSTFQNPTHIYNDADVFTAECIVTDEDGDVGSSSTDVTVKSPNLTVTIDIKPDSDENVINLNGNGVIPIAILSSETFDATTIIPSSIIVEPGNAKIAHKKAHIKDVNLDNKDDLLIHVGKSDILLIKSGEIVIKGKTVNGISIKGSSDVILKGSKISEN